MYESILITGVGIGTVGNQILKTIRQKKYQFKIIITNISKESFGLQDSDKSCIVPRGTSKNYISNILKICRKENVKFIFPGSEQELLVLSKKKDFFKQKGIIVVSNSYKIVKLCLDKGKLFEFLKTKNVEIPDFQVVKKINDFKKCKTPTIIKPVNGSGSKSVFLAETIDEVKFFTEYLISRGHEVIIQEYVGSGNEEYTVGVIRLQNGKIKTSIAMKRDLSKTISCKEDIKSKKTNKRFQISTGISQGWFDEFKKIREQCEEISDVLEVEGPINIQCRKTKRGIIPFEINPRFSGTTFLRSMVGFNEPNIIMEYYLHNKIPQQKKIPKKYIFRDLFEGVLE
jgi:carbamoyl-phosphate synthase large subunit